MEQKFITVFCSSKAVEDKYVEAARKFAELMTKRGYGLVYGASDVGLMKEVSSVVEENGGKIIGVTIDVFQDVAKHEGISEMILAPSLAERKTLMLQKTDAIVILVGGIGTLDEASEIIELKKEGKHHKPVVFLNTDNFYSGLKTQFEKMHNEGFVKEPLENFFHFSDIPEDAIDYIDKNLASK